MRKNSFWVSFQRLPAFTSLKPLLRNVQIVAICLGLFVPSSLKAQGLAPSLLWQTNVHAGVIAVDELTNVYASSNGTVIKLSADGVPLQTNILSQLPGRALRDAAGNFYFAGVRPAFFNTQTYEYGTTNSCFLAKYTSAGSLVWSNGFGPTGQLRSIQIKDLQGDTNGGVYIGYTYSITTSGHTSSVAKFDSSGTDLWAAAMPGVPLETTLGAIRFGHIFPTNGYVITYVNNNTFTWITTLSQFDNNGAAIVITNWSPAYGVIPFSYGLTPPLIQDASENFYTSEGAANQIPVTLTKRDPQGNVIWADNLEFTNFAAVGADSYGGVLLADGNSHLLRYDADGSRVWVMNLPANCQEVLPDTSKNRFLSLSDGSIARIGGESLTAPTITNSPQSQTTFAGSNVVLSVGASGFSPLRYYWFFNGSLLAVQSNASLSLPNVTTNQAGSYYFIASNIVNTATSTPVQLRVQQVALYAGNQMLTNGTYTFSNNPTITVRSAFTNGSSFYTLDGSTPSFNSTLYSGPLQLFSNVTVRAIGYSADFSQSEEADAVNAVILARHNLSILTSGGGHMIVDPSGPDYVSSQTVTATAIPNPGWSFLYWTGDATGSDNPLEILMNSDKVIHAVFGTTLSTTVQGNGQVLVYPPGGLYSYGQVVRLTAVPGAGSYFGAWGNAATGNANPLYLTMTSTNPIVSSIFGTNGPNQVTLTVNINGLGSVTTSPQANVYTTGQSVTLTPTADSGQTFVNWTGDATGTQNPLNITLNQSKVITANFTGASPRLRVSSVLGEGLRPEGFRFSLLSDPNSVYEILYSSNFLSWNSLRFVTNNAGGETSLLDTNAVKFPRRYYQIKP